MPELVEWAQEHGMRADLPVEMLAGLHHRHGPLDEGDDTQERTANVDLSKPILVLNGEPVELVDGRHRVAKAKHDGVSELPALIIGELPEKYQSRPEEYAKAGRKPKAPAVPKVPVAKPRFIDPHGELSHVPHLHFTPTPVTGSSKIRYADGTYSWVHPSRHKDGEFHVVDSLYRSLGGPGSVGPGALVSTMSPGEIDAIGKSLKETHGHLVPHLAQIRDVYYGDHPDQQARMKAISAPLAVFSDRLEEMGHPQAENIKKFAGYKSTTAPVEYDELGGEAGEDDDFVPGPDGPGDIAPGFVMNPENK